jgi:hypothetical protein
MIDEDVGIKIVNIEKEEVQEERKIENKFLLMIMANEKKFGSK